MGSLKMKNIFTVLISVLAIVVIISSVSYADLEIAGHFADRFKDEKNLNTDPNELLNQVFAADRDFDESNEICIGGPDGGGPAVSRLRITGIIDINYDGPNTTTIYKKGKEPLKVSKETSEHDAMYFNAMSKVVTESVESGKPLQSGNDDIYGAAFSKFMYEDLRSYFKYALGSDPVPSVGWEIVPGAKAYIKECEQHGKEVLSYTIEGGFKVSDKYKPDEAGCQSVSSTSEDVYVGPFTYSSKQKVDFGNIEVNGTNEGETVYSEKIDKVTSDRLFVKDSSGFKGVNFVEPETQFYVKVNKKVEEASKIQVKITAKGNNNKYYKARILVLAAEGVPTQNTAIFTGKGEEKLPGGNSITFEFENSKGNLQINKKGIYTTKEVSKVENMGYKLYYLEGTKKQYLKITTDSKTTYGKLVGDITVKKQEPTDEKNATVVYTDSSGQMMIRKISSKYQYYLQEVSDDSEFSSNILEATQKLDKEESVPIVDKGVIGPITVEKKSKAEKTIVKIVDAKKVGNLNIVKSDLNNTDSRISGVKFKVQNADTKQWVKAEGSKGVYNLKTYDKDFKTNKEYYKDNYTSNEDEATEFETAEDGEVTINGVDIGRYTIKETYIKYGTDDLHYGYTPEDKPEDIDPHYVWWSTDGGKTKYRSTEKAIIIDVADSDSTSKSTIYILNEKRYGTLHIVKADLDKTEDRLAGVKFLVKNSENKYLVANYKDGEYFIEKYTDNKGEATEFETNDSGEIAIRDAKLGIYELEEIYIDSKNEGYTPRKHPEEVDPHYIWWSTDGGKTKKCVADEPIKIEVQNPSEGKSTIYVLNEKNYGVLHILKTDLDKTEERLAGVRFRVKNSENQYLIATYEDAEGVYYVENYTSNKDEATEFETNKSGEVDIKDVKVGSYELEEIYIDNKNKDYTPRKHPEDVDPYYVWWSTDGGKTKKRVADEPIKIEVQNPNREAEGKSTIYVLNEKNYGYLNIIKKDFHREDKRIAGVKFRVKNDKNQYLIATYEEAEGVYYNEEYTSDARLATEFETNNSGEITIKDVKVGNYVLEEVYIENKKGTINYGYTEVDDPRNVDPKFVFWSTDDGKTKKSVADEAINMEVKNPYKVADEKSKIYVINKKKYLKITGYIWEDMLGGKSNDYEAYGKDIYADGEPLLDGITVRLKDKSGNIVKIGTTKDGGKYLFEEVSVEAIENGDYYVEFEYNGLTYTSVIALVGDDSSINSKASEVVEQRKKLNEAFTEITNKNNIENRSNGYSRNGSGNVTGELTYTNDTENWISKYENSTYNNETYSGLNLTANTDVAGYKLEEEFKAGRYIVDESDAFVIENVNLGLVKREQPQISISDDIEKAIVEVNGYSHEYLYSQRNSNVQDGSAFNVAVKFGKEYVDGYTRAIYPSDVQFSSELASRDDARKLKVDVIYSVTIRNLSNSLKMGVGELVNYYDKEYTIIDSWVEGDDSKRVVWNNTSKYGQSYDDGKYVGSYTTSLADTKINAGESLTVYIKFRVSDGAVLGLLSEKATLNNTTEIFSYSTYYGTNKEGCAEGDIYAAVDTASAPGNAKPGDKNTYEADTDDAPSLLLEAKGVRELAGTVFEDSTSSELKSGEERRGDGIYNDGENIVSGVTVELLRAEDLAIATIYPPKDTDTAEGTEVSTADSGRDAKFITTADGKYIFRGIEPDKYLLKYTYENGVTKIFDTTGKEVKDVTVQGYKSTIIASDKIKEAFEDNENHLRWFVETEKEGRYSDARDDYELRQAIDEELVDLDDKTEFTNKQIDANTPKFEVGVEKESIYTASTGDRYSNLTENIDFGIVERPRQAAMLDKEVAYLKVTLPNGQVLIDGDPRKDNLDYVSITKDPSTGKIKEIYITIDTELIYGSHLEIKYDYTLTNTSELDYKDKDYYYYGVGGKEPVKFTSATLLDFVDSEVVLKAGQEGTWQVLDIAKDGLDITPEEREALLKNFSTLVTAEAIPTGVSIASGESVTASIFVERILANKDELSYDNNGEIIKLSKTGGSTFTTKFGNYAKVLAKDPESDAVEPDEAKSDRVTIIPPTGTTDNTNLYVMIGATCLVVLGAGIFGIKRFLKK